MSDLSKTILVNSPGSMAAFGETIANHLLPGHPIALTGHVGAGKSFLSRAIIQNIIGPQDVPSPTFTLVQTYETEGYDIWHTDLYRLTAIDQVDELGLWDALRDDVCLIEWPELMREHLPSTTLHIDITIPEGAETRQLTLRSADPHWAPLMDTKND